MYVRAVDTYVHTSCSNWAHPLTTFYFVLQASLDGSSFPSKEKDEDADTLEKVELPRA